MSSVGAFDVQRCATTARSKNTTRVEGGQRKRVFCQPRQVGRSGKVNHAHRVHTYTPHPRTLLVTLPLTWGLPRTQGPSNREGRVWSLLTPMSS